MNTDYSKKKNPYFDLFYYLNLFQVHLSNKIYIYYIFIIISVFIDIAGISFLFPIFDYIINEKQSLDVDFITSLYVYLDIELNEKNLILLVISIFFIKGLVSFFAIYYNTKLRAELLKVYKNKIYSYIKNISFTNYTKFDYGFYNNHMNELVLKSTYAFHFLGLFLSQLISGLIYMLIAIIYSGVLSILLLLVGIVVIIIFKSINRNVRLMSRENALETSRFNQLYIQILNNFNYLKSTSSFGFFDKKIYQSTSKLSLLDKKLGKSYAISNSLKEPFLIIFILLFLFVTIKFELISSTLLLITLGLFYRSSNSFFTMQSSWQKFLESVGSVEKVNEHIFYLESNNDSSKNLLLSKIDSLYLKNVCYSYENDRVINGLSYNFEKGFLYSLVGKSGSGKSTLTKLIIGLIQPLSGDIYINGKIQKNFTIENIGYLPQNPVIFDGTIFQNITLNNNTSDHKSEVIVRKLCNDLGLFEFINELDDDIHSYIYSGMSNLSGGQIQRICLARELFKNPSILILDEPTSALDKNSEILVLNKLNTIKNNLLIIVISHSNFIIENCDKNLFLSAESNVNDKNT